MSKRFIIIFSIFVLSSLVGGFFLFKNQEILKQNPFLASIIGFKGYIVLSETDLVALKDNINFLEKELKTRENELEELDDLLEENDLLNQKLIDLFWEIEALQMAIFEFENSQNQEEDPEEDTGEEDEEELENELEEDVEKEKNTDCRGKININIASKEDLEKIKGVGPATAQKIIGARPFLSLYDLLKISGIGEKTLEGIKEQGCAFVENDTGATPSVVVPVSTGGGGGSSVLQPQILLSFLPENPVNKEIEVDLSVLNLKNTNYDVKISILKISDESEQARTLTEICSEDKTNCESSSYKYLVNAISSEPNFPTKFKLKMIKDIEGDFPYETDIIVKIRQNDNQKVVSEFKGKINITEPEIDPVVKYNLTFEVKDERGEFIEGAEVNLIDFTTEATNKIGVVIFEKIEVGTYSYTVSKEYYTTASGTVEVVDDVIREVILEKALIINVEQFGTVIHSEKAPPPVGWESTGTVVGSTTGTHNRPGSAVGAMSATSGAGGDLISPIFDFSKEENISVSWRFRGTSTAEGSVTLYYSIDEEEWIEKYKHDIPSDSKWHEYSVEGINELNNQSNVRFKWKISCKDGHNSIDDITITRQNQ
jgi:competence ComEA-like helix-hairpin-helix protein